MFAMNDESKARSSKQATICARKRRLGRVLTPAIDPIIVRQLLIARSTVSRMSWTLVCERSAFQKDGANRVEAKEFGDALRTRLRTAFPIIA
jgi:hypothetical protein